MQLRSEIEIATMIRAMKEVVIPAVDPDDGPALEQSQLVVAMLDLLRQQLRVQFRFDRAELECLATSAETLSQLCAAEPALAEIVRTVAAAGADARRRLQQCAVDPAVLHDGSLVLRETIGRLVTAADETAAPERWAAIERHVLESSRELLLLERAFIAPQGWESAAGAPRIDDLLDAPSQHPTERSLR